MPPKGNARKRKADTNSTPRSVSTRAVQKPAIEPPEQPTNAPTTIETLESTPEPIEADDSEIDSSDNEDDIDTIATSLTPRTPISKKPKTSSGNTPVNLFRNSAPTNGPPLERSGSKLTNSLMQCFHSDLRADLIAVSKLNIYKAVLNYHLRLAFWKKRSYEPKERAIVQATALSSAALPASTLKQLENQIHEHYNYLNKSLRKQFAGLLRQFIEHPAAQHPNWAIEQASFIGWLPATPLVPVEDIINQFLQNNFKLIHEVWAPIVDVASPEYLTSPAGAIWGNYFQKVTAVILQQFIDQHYLDVYHRERAKHAQNPRQVPTVRPSLDGHSTSKTSAQLASAPSPASKNEKVELSKAQTKAIQTGDSVRAPNDWPSIHKPEKWSIQKPKVIVYGELKYNGYTNAMSVEDFDVLVEENLPLAAAKEKPKCTCSASLDIVTTELTAEVVSCKERIQTVCQHIDTTFDKLTQTRSSLTSVLNDTDKWMQYKTKLTLEKVQNINAYEIISDSLRQINEDFEAAYKRSVEADALQKPLDPKFPTTLDELKNYQLWKHTLRQCLAVDKASSMPITPDDINLNIVLTAPKKPEYLPPASNAVPPSSHPPPSTQTSFTPQNISPIQEHYPASHHTNTPLHYNHPITQSFHNTASHHHNLTDNGSFHGYPTVQSFNTKADPRTPTPDAASGVEDSDLSQASQASHTQFGDVCPTPTSLTEHAPAVLR
ncbi:hypothetical protein L211DRAFT_847314 [Terfezia boudieri ATCC MYA-4762]|uniref:Uncharacterized protein n=1 Tax=Terfezia boudieri ATCC MYA-4762 TaxID=1051890 RepID=A0A3N4LWS2_9PEZI|nr:hypothetical protein L211DRAFT_847314 [Terfezia boudieri ATCC MYA-4762]